MVSLGSHRACEVLEHPPNLGNLPRTSPTHTENIPMIIDHNDRTYVLDLHAQGKSPDYIAAALTQRRVLAAVMGVLRDHAGNLHQSELVRSMMHYVFMPPRVAG